MLTTARVVWRSLLHHRRIHMAVMLGVAAATAVLTGALVVGDSVRYSLRALVLDRLGRIDQQLIAERFFRKELVEELKARPGFERDFATVSGGLIVPGGTLEIAVGRESRRASNVLVIGGDASFWDLGTSAGRPKSLPGTDEIVLNAPLADELGVQIGDKVILRLPKSNQVPADSPLGRKTERIRTLADLRVVDIVPGEGLGRFSLRSSQHFPRNAYLAPEMLQTALAQDDKLNAIFLAGQPGSSAAADARIAQALLQPTLSDLGLAIRRVRQTKDQDQVVFDYYQLSSDRLLLDPSVVQAAQRVFSPEDTQVVVTYLANSIEKVDDPRGDKRPVIPYSTITALDATGPLNPLVDDQGQSLGPLADDDIVLNSWAAEDLGVQVGDKIRVTWFAPETTHTVATETSAEFRLKAIVRITEPVQGIRDHRPAKFEDAPTRANDPDLTPTVEGVTDQASINDWDPPFPYDPRRVRRQDDKYWQMHRTTPKAFVSLATGRRLWGSRFGDTTSVRVVAREGVTEEQLAERLLRELDQAESRLGLEFIAIKQRSLDAARGTTPFDALFLSLSFFIIAAALLLVALLYRLGIEQRATEIGLLLALGWPIRRVVRMLAAEGALVAALGGVLGLLGGLAYAWLMLIGLRTWWLGAIATPFLQWHASTRSLAIGYASGVLVGALVIWVSVRRVRREPVRQLVAGRWSSAAGMTPIGATSFGERVLRWATWGLSLTAVISSIAATQLGGEAQAGAFVAAGLFLLVALLLGLWRWFRGGSGDVDAGAGALQWGVAGLAVRNAGRNPSRSVLTIGLMAIACFLIVAMSAFRLDPTRSGSGGFTLLAESSQPIFVDLNSDEFRSDLSRDRRKLLEGSSIFGLRLQPGDDASCNNLYQATQPRVLGVPVSLVEHFERSDATPFSWAGTAAHDDAQRKNPWRLLRESSADDAVPVVLDKNTALYSLHLYGGIGQTFSITYEGGVEAKFRVVGLLSNSVLQGSLLVDEQQFKRLFPLVSGYRVFLVNTPEEQQKEIAQALEEQLSDEGFDATGTSQLLKDYLAVQNTYLSTFQSLGALGLLLGTFGLATIQLRSVFERRGELALMRASGFRRRRLAALVLVEHALLLAAGLGTGVVAALVAVLPHMVLGGARAPLSELLAILLGIVVIGMASGLGAMRATLRAPLIGALRGD